MLLPFLLLFFLFSLFLLSSLLSSLLSFLCLSLLLLLLLLLFFLFLFLVLHLSLLLLFLSLLLLLSLLLFPLLLLLSLLLPLPLLFLLVKLLLLFFSPFSSSSFSAASSSSSFPLGQTPAPVFLPFSSSSSFSAASSSSSFMDFAAFQAHSLDLSSEYQSLARWYFQFGGGGSDFLSYVASFFPHLSADASRDFSSGSSLFLSALRSLASAPPSAPPPSFGAPVLPPVSLPWLAASLSVSATPPAVLLRPSFSSSFPHPPVSTPVPSALPLEFSTPLRGSPLPLLLVFLPLLHLFLFLSLLWPLLLLLAFLCSPLLHLCLCFRGLLLLRFLWLLRWFEAPAPLFCPFTVSGSLEPLVSSSVATPGAVPDFASQVPPQPPVSAAPSASAYVGSADDHFDLGYPDAVLRDPEVPLPTSLPDSFQAEIRHMYAYLVDLFPQAAGAPPVDPPP